MSTIFDSLVNSENYLANRRSMMNALRKGLSEISSVRPPRAELKESYEKAVSRVGALRGRDLFFKYVGSGAGSGPFVELADGSVKYDLITGIGVNFFGHGNIDLFEATFDSLWCDIMQGNLGPNPEYLGLLESLLAEVGQKSRIRNGWLTTCGATANEIALKIIRQKKFPASRIMAFKGCFAGRTTALQELTDNPKYREGQPVYGEVSYIPFFDPHSKKSPQEQASASIAVMKEELARYPGKFAALEFEIVQGEGGFVYAPREFLLPIIMEARANGLAIWDDEIQTFGRTGEVFCYQKFGLDEFIDVVTVAKLLQTGAVLWTPEYSPKAGLVSGTFAGSSAALKAGQWTIQQLKEKVAGSQGRIQALEKITISELERLKSSASVGKYILDYTSVGGMIAFTILNGTLDETKKFLFNLFDLGAVAFFCGHGPYRVRMLPPFGVITDSQWRDVFKLIEEALLKTAKELKA